MPPHDQLRASNIFREGIKRGNTVVTVDNYISRLICTIRIDRSRDWTASAMGEPIYRLIALTNMAS